jgi:hypothetical protein
LKQCLITVGHDKIANASSQKLNDRAANPAGPDHDGRAVSVLLSNSCKHAGFSLEYRVAYRVAYRVVGFELTTNLE